MVEEKKDLMVPWWCQLERNLERFYGRVKFEVLEGGRILVVAGPERETKWVGSLVRSWVKFGVGNTS